MKLMKLMLMLTVVATLGACQKSKSVHNDKTPVFDGAWNGNVRADNFGAYVFRLDFTQGATTLDGTFRITANNVVILTGDAVGSWNGVEVDFTLTPDAPCTGSYSFASDRNGQLMPYSVNGTGSCLDIVNGYGQLVAELPIRM